jgi:hypothetical protein
MLFVRVAQCRIQIDHPRVLTVQISLTDRVLSFTESSSTTQRMMTLLSTFWTSQRQHSYYRSCLI